MENLITTKRTTYVGSAWGPVSASKNFESIISIVIIIRIIIYFQISQYK